jgi:hypothetical protein
MSGRGANTEARAAGKMRTAGGASMSAEAAIFFEARRLMNFALINLLYTVGLLLGMLFLLEAGRRIGLRRVAMADLRKSVN